MVEHLFVGKNQIKSRYEILRDIINKCAVNRFEDDAAKRQYQAICDPGPDLVILDEGHRIKNKNTAFYKVISTIYYQAFKLIKTPRKILLTGYPLQVKSRIKTEQSDRVLHNDKLLCR